VYRKALNRNYNVYIVAGQEKPHM